MILRFDVEYHEHHIIIKKNDLVEILNTHESPVNGNQIVASAVIYTEDEKGEKRSFPMILKMGALAFTTRVDDEALIQRGFKNNENQSS